MVFKRMYKCEYCGKKIRDDDDVVKRHFKICQKKKESDAEDLKSDAFWAIKLTKFNKFKYLIEKRNISINLINDNNETFLMTYIRMHDDDHKMNYSFLFYFLSNGINVNYKGNNGKTALMLVIEKGMFQYTIDMLQFYANYADADKSIKFNINIQNNFGETALMIAANFHNSPTRRSDIPIEDLIIALFKYGANNTIRNHSFGIAEYMTPDPKLRQLIKNKGIIE